MKRITEVTYRKPPSGNDPREIVTVTLKQDWVPRKGELLNISMEVEPGEFFIAHSRVVDVCYVLTSKIAEATVILK